VYMTDLFTIA